MEQKEEKRPTSNVNANEHSKLIVCYFSDNLFNGFQVCIETEKLNLSEPENLKHVIITYCYNELYNHLRTFKFDLLLFELNRKKESFHIHQNIRFPLVMNLPIYVCSH
jgi:hypothetical protein